jgi:hypothetical protein
MAVAQALAFVARVLKSEEQLRLKMYSEPGLAWAEVRRRRGGHPPS